MSDVPDVKREPETFRVTLEKFLDLMAGHLLSVKNKQADMDQRLSQLELSLDDLGLLVKDVSETANTPCHCENKIH